MSSKLDERLERHFDGREKTTRAYRPFELIHTEVVETRLEARKRAIAIDKKQKISTFTE